MNKKVVKIALIYGAIIAVACAVLWPLFDMLTAKFFTHSEFVYTPQAYIVRPVMFGVIAGVVIGMTNNPEKK